MCIVCVQLGVCLSLSSGVEAPLPVGRSANGSPVDVPADVRPCGDVDVAASAFLSDTLAAVAAAGSPLVPVRVDGDGYCLTCAASRSLVGSELLYHRLRARVHAELVQNSEHSSSIPSVSAADVAEAISAATPGWAPFVPYSPELHAAALANVLRRPVVRLSSAGRYLPPFPCCCAGRAGCVCASAGAGLGRRE